MILKGALAAGLIGALAYLFLRLERMESERRVVVQAVGGTADLESRLAQAERRIAEAEARLASSERAVRNAVDAVRDVEEAAASRMASLAEAVAARPPQISTPAPLKTPISDAFCESLTGEDRLATMLRSTAKRIGRDMTLDELSRLVGPTRSLLDASQEYFRDKEKRSEQEEYIALREMHRQDSLYRRTTKEILGDVAAEKIFGH